MITTLLPLWHICREITKYGVLFEIDVYAAFVLFYSLWLNVKYIVINLYSFIYIYIIIFIYEPVFHLFIFDTLILSLTILNKGNSVVVL